MGAAMQDCFIKFPAVHRSLVFIIIHINKINNNDAAQRCSLSCRASLFAVLL
jgi:hypothetical protein